MVISTVNKKTHLIYVGGGNVEVSLALKDKGEDLHVRVYDFTNDHSADAIVVQNVKTHIAHLYKLNKKVPPKREQLIESEYAIKDDSLKTVPPLSIEIKTAALNKFTVETFKGTVNYTYLQKRIATLSLQNMTRFDTTRNHTGRIEKAETVVFPDLSFEAIYSDNPNELVAVEVFFAKQRMFITRQVMLTSIKQLLQCMNDVENKVPKEELTQFCREKLEKPVAKLTSSTPIKL